MEFYSIKFNELILTILLIILSQFHDDNDNDGNDDMEDTNVDNDVAGNGKIVSNDSSGIWIWLYLR